MGPQCPPPLAVASCPKLQLSLSFQNTGVKILLCAFLLPLLEGQLQTTNLTTKGWVSWS